MATSILVVVAYLAGASWGPQVTLHEIDGLEACKAMRASISQQIVKTAKSNSTGGEVTAGDDGDDVVVQAASGREVARLSCLGGSGRPAR